MINSENIFLCLCCLTSLNYKNMFFGLSLWRLREKYSNNQKKSMTLIVLIIWLLFVLVIFIWVTLPLFGSWEKNNQIIKKKSKTLILLIIWMITKMCVFVCIALPLFESWKNVKSIGYFNHFIYSETECFLFVHPYQSLDAGRKIIKYSKKKIKNVDWYDFLIDSKTE